MLHLTENQKGNVLDLLKGGIKNQSHIKKRSRSERLVQAHLYTGNGKRGGENRVIVGGGITARLVEAALHTEDGVTVGGGGGGGGGATREVRLPLEVAAAGAGGEALQTGNLMNAYEKRRKVEGVPPRQILKQENDPAAKAPTMVLLFDQIWPRRGLPQVK